MMPGRELTDAEFAEALRRRRNAQPSSRELREIAGEADALYDRWHPPARGSLGESLWDESPCQGGR